MDPYRFDPYAQPPHSAPPRMQQYHSHGYGHSPSPMPHHPMMPPSAPVPMHPAMMQRAAMEREMRMRQMHPHALGQWPGMVAGPPGAPGMSRMAMGMGGRHMGGPMGGQMGGLMGVGGPMGPHGMPGFYGDGDYPRRRRRRRRRRSRSSRRHSESAESSESSDSEPGFRDKLKEAAKSAVKGAASGVKNAVLAAKDKIRGERSDEEAEDEEDDEDDSKTNAAELGNHGYRSTRSPSGSTKIANRSTRSHYGSPTRSPREVAERSPRISPRFAPDERVPLNEGSVSTDASGSDGELLATDSGAGRRAASVMRGGGKEEAFELAVEEGMVYIVEKRGKYHRRLDAGEHQLRKDEKVAYVHSLKEDHMKLPRVDARTRDGKAVVVRGVLTVQITDPVAASYAVDTPFSRLGEASAQAIREAAAACYSARIRQEAEELGRGAMHRANSSAVSWGIHVLRADLRVELSDDAEAAGGEPDDIELGESWYEEPKSRSSRRRAQTPGPAVRGASSSAVGDAGDMPLRSNSGGSAIRAHRDVPITQPGSWRIE